ncbi:MAG: c-type cytochrome [Gammaproteobacteria bacterium]
MRRKLPGVGGSLSIKATWPCALAMLLGPLSGPVLAQGDAEAGEMKADTCLGCHGIPGYTNVYPTYHVPKLGGQHAEYIVAALQAYKAGQRDHDTMHAQAEALSDKDMADIGAYFESLGPSMAESGGAQQRPAAKSGGGQKAAQQKPAKADAAAGGGAQAGGQQTYAQVCGTCHDSGVAGAPKLTDTAAWQPRIKQGKQTLYKHAIGGLGTMPPKGGDASLSDEEVQVAVDYMVSQVSSAGGQSGKTAGAGQSQPGNAKKGQ